MRRCTRRSSRLRRRRFSGRPARRDQRADGPGQDRPSGGYICAVIGIIGCDRPTPLLSGFGRHRSAVPRDAAQPKVDESAVIGGTDPYSLNSTGFPTLSFRRSALRLGA